MVYPCSTIIVSENIILTQITVRVFYHIPELVRTFRSIRLSSLLEPNGIAKLGQAGTSTPLVAAGEESLAFGVVEIIPRTIETNLIDKLQTLWLRNISPYIFRNHQFIVCCHLCSIVSNRDFITCCTNGQT